MRARLWAVSRAAILVSRPVAGFPLEIACATASSAGATAAQSWHNMAMSVPASSVLIALSPFS